MRGFAAFRLLTASTFSLAAMAQNPAPANSGRVDFTGIWNSATATPLERPARLKEKVFFTPAEAAKWEGDTAAANAEPAPAQAKNTGTGTYNTAFREFGVHVVKTLRTSIITDPPDGRIPPLTAAAAAAKQARTARLKNPSGSRDTGLQDQCLIFPTAVPPMMPYTYNSNYQFIETPGAIMIHVEMIHDTRVIYMDGRPHAPDGARSWLGDSIGRWEGGTLVVDTTNFNDANGWFGDAGGMFGWDRNLHVVERFSRFDAETLLYRFEVDDPTAFTKPWKGELTMVRAPGPIYEYACHEGNYALPNLLRGYRASEAAGARR
jgi:hypothetical protein